MDAVFAKIAKDTTNFALGDEEVREVYLDTAHRDYFKIC
jgi:hypothetical protein